ncbi:hypothetical protein BU16DRAFT_378862 [Lophium mytilinum]|uniref:Uncharacterized protein n=1 Tax=Lophium mytilinum TaxID=390894 RepID=A0A6A6QRC9_9PEZI|nr:hypothetical protein BU16DRAFT_378862 [Lophium mytilinum]
MGGKLGRAVLYTAQTRAGILVKKFPRVSRSCVVLLRISLRFGYHIMFSLSSHFSPLAFPGIYRMQQRLGGSSRRMAVALIVRICFLDWIRRGQVYSTLPTCILAARRGPIRSIRPQLQVAVLGLVRHGHAPMRARCVQISNHTRDFVPPMPLRLVYSTMQATPAY